jgi:drug/metabolite transporter (DMT)-like permease
LALVAILAALGAALLYAVASVLQHWEAERQPADRSLGLKLIAKLAQRPRWLAGLVFDVGGYLLQWVALTIGSLVVVQPLLVVGLLLALPMKAWLSGYRFHGWDWNGACLTTAGLAVFLVVSRPATGHTEVKPLVWVALLCAGGAVTAMLVAFGHESSPRWKAIAYGTAGGVVYGACAALTKSCAHLLSVGVSALFESWQPYFLLGAGILGMVLAQSAFQAGPLDASLPTLSATDPIVSVFIGAAAFGETVRTGIVPTTVEVISFAAIVIGIFMLAHTDVVKVAQRHYTLEQEREKAKTEPEAPSGPSPSPGGAPTGSPPQQAAAPLSVRLPPTGHYERR